MGVSEGPTDAPKPAPRRLELVLSGDHGLDSHPPPAPNGVAVEVTGKVPSAAAAPKDVPFDVAEAKMIRSLAGWLGITAIATLGVCGVLAAQWAQGRGSVPSAVAAVLTGAVGVWTLLAGWHLGRVVRTDHDDAHELVSAFGNLRSILILKAIGLFLVLGLSCFAFSIIASLLALL